MTLNVGFSPSHKAREKIADFVEIYVPAPRATVLRVEVHGRKHILVIYNYNISHSLSSSGDQEYNKGLVVTCHPILGKTNFNLKPHNFCRYDIAADTSRPQHEVVARVIDDQRANLDRPRNGGSRQ